MSQLRFQGKRCINRGRLQVMTRDSKKGDTRDAKIAMVLAVRYEVIELAAPARHARLRPIGPAV